LVKQALKRCYGERAAALLGFASRHRLYRIMVKPGINPKAED
jgi:hypothetical protein